MATSRPPVPKVDIQGLIEDWATDYFRRKASKKELKLLKQDQIRTEIDWKRVKFVHEDAVYEPEPPTPGSGRPTQNVLFNTNFTNRTDKPQRYTFRAERTTRSSCTVAIEQGYTKGFEMNVKLTTPCQIMEANAGFRREITLTNSESETIEEELTWGVDSEIEVEGHKVGEAKLLILEEKYEGRFSIKTHISGRVRVVFTNLKDNNSFIKAAENQVVSIVEDAIRSKSIQPSEALHVDGSMQRVTLITRGNCQFKYGFKQLIEVAQKPIGDNVSETSS
jgi:hypothetical protein